MMVHLTEEEKELMDKLQNSNIPEKEKDKIRCRLKEIYKEKCYPFDYD